MLFLPPDLFLLFLKHFTLSDSVFSLPCLDVQPKLHSESFSSLHTLFCHPFKTAPTVLQFFLCPLFLTPLGLYCQCLISISILSCCPFNIVTAVLKLYTRTYTLLLIPTILHSEIFSFLPTLSLTSLQYNIHNACSLIYKPQPSIGSRAAHSFLSFMASAGRISVEFSGEFHIMKTSCIIWKQCKRSFYQWVCITYYKSSHTQRRCGTPGGSVVLRVEACNFSGAW